MNIFRTHKLIKTLQERIRQFDLENNLRYSEEDRENIFPKGMTDEEFIKYIQLIFLGEEFISSTPISHNQRNEVVLQNIVSLFEKSRMHF